MSAALIVRNTSHSGPGIALIIPLEVAAIALAPEYRETSSSTMLSPSTPRKAASSTDHTLSTTKARHNPNNTALGDPNVLMSE